CAVCGETHLISELPSLTNRNHLPQVCSDCYHGWLESELNLKSQKEIKCPEMGCKELPNHAEMQQYASPESFARFDALSVRDALTDDPNFRWCRNPNCDSGQIFEPDHSSHIFWCIACGFESCNFLGEGVHEGETCKEFD
ncbi:uncharacterized protein BDZ99DRAFT_355100, partial [Mytilinidion resinicola]